MQTSGSTKSTLILRHIATYRVMVPTVICQLLGQANAQDLVNRLVRRRLIAVHDDRTFGRLLTLTPRGVALLGEHAPRARLTSASIRTDLAILGYCVERPRARVRLSQDELAKLFDQVPQANHCIDRETGWVFQAYVPGRDAGPPLIRKRLRSRLNAALGCASVRQWVESRRYGITVLVESPQRKTLLERELSRSGRHGGRPITEDVTIRVDRIPPLPGTPPAATPAA